MTVEKVNARTIEAEKSIDKIKGSVKAEWLKDNGWILLVDNEQKVKTENYYSSSKKLPEDSKVLFVDGKEQLNPKLANWVTYCDWKLRGDGNVRKVLEEVDLRFMVNLADTNEVQVVISGVVENGDRFMNTVTVRVDRTKEVLEKDLASLECDLK